MSKTYIIRSVNYKLAKLPLKLLRKGMFSDKEFHNLTAEEKRNGSN